MDEPGASLIRALATELAWFCRRPKDRSDVLHLGVGYLPLCDYVGDPRMPHDCSSHCQRVRAVLQHAAERLACPVESFYTPPKKTRRRQTAPLELP